MKEKNGLPGKIESFISETLSTKMNGLIKTHCIYTLNLHNIQDVLKYVLEPVLDDTPSDLNTGDLVFTPSSLDPNTQISHLDFYKGTPIILYNVRYGNGNNEGNWTYLFASTIRTSNGIKHIKEYINKLYHKSIRLAQIDWENEVRFYTSRYFQSKYKCHKKTINDDVFLPNVVKQQIMNSLDEFMNKRDWYDEHGIPYHFGILLYGMPGSGKSSLAEAIGNYVHGKQIIITGDDIGSLPDLFTYELRNAAPADSKQIQCLIIEDIDVGFTQDPFRGFRSYNQEDDGDENKKRNSGMAKLLNSLDGINAPQDTIYIFTTNHIERLDPALIRPGRIDLKIEMNNITVEALIQFSKKFYGMTIDESIITQSEIPNDLTIAELQTEVMKGKSFEELIDYIKGRCENNGGSTV